METEGVVSTLERAPNTFEAPLFHARPESDVELKGSKKKSKKNKSVTEAGSLIYELFDRSRDLVTTVTTSTKSWIDEMWGRHERAEAAHEEGSFLQRLGESISLWGKDESDTSSEFTLGIDDYFPPATTETTFNHTGEPLDFFRINSATTEEEPTPAALSLSHLLAEPLVRTGHRLQELFKKSTPAESPTESAVEDDSSVAMTELHPVLPLIIDHEGRRSPAQVAERETGIDSHVVIERPQERPQTLLNKVRTLGVVGYGLHELSQRMTTTRTEQSVHSELRIATPSEQGTVRSVTTTETITAIESSHTHAPETTASVPEATHITGTTEAPTVSAAAAESPKVTNKWFVAPRAAETTTTQSTIHEASIKPRRVQREAVSPVLAPRPIEKAPAKRMTETEPALTQKRPERTTRPAIPRMNNKIIKPLKMRSNSEHMSSHREPITDRKSVFFYPKLKPESSAKRVINTDKQPRSSKLEHAAATSEKIGISPKSPEYKKDTMGATASTSAATIPANAAAPKPPKITIDDYLGRRRAELKQALIDRPRRSRKRQEWRQRYARPIFLAKRSAQVASGGGVAYLAVRLVF